MNNFENYYNLEIIAMHIPIVALLILLSWQVFSKLGVQAFKYICFAWSLQIVHVIISFLKTYSEVYNNPGIFTDEFISDLIATFKETSDVFCSFLFLCAAFVGSNRNTNSSPFNRKNNLIITIFFVILFFITYNYFLNDFDKNPLIPIFSIINIPISLFAFYSLKKLADYFSEEFKGFDTSRYLYYGTLGYGLIQFLLIFQSDTLPFSSHFGYSFSLLFKGLILFGLQTVLILYAKKKADEEVKREKLIVIQEETKALNSVLNRILGRTYHEITGPLRTIQNRLDKLLSSESSVYKLSKGTKIELNIIESNYNRLAAVVDASMKMYEEGIGVNGFEDKKFVIQNDQELSPNNINTLIEIAIITLKDIATDEESISFTRDYGGGCNIICFPYEITQIIYNLIKNSYDSFQDGKGRIFIKTKVHTSFTEDYDEFKYLVVNIADNGRGILNSNLDKVFNEGFTTKKEAGRGFGLSIVKELVEKNQGNIQMKSPYKFSDFNSDITSGTLISLTFPIII